MATQKIQSSKAKRIAPAKAKADTDEAPNNVINIMDALKKSIASEGKRKKG